jgi:subtilisin family serine protease
MCPSPVNQPGKSENCSLGADVISCSWGEDDATEGYLKQIVAAWEKAGIVSVFAVGNAGPTCGTSVSPSDYEGVIGVGASSQDDDIMAYSSRGPANINSSMFAEIDPIPYTKLAPSIVAPGYDINGPSCNNNDGYKGFSGTSQAAPHVAGAAALLLSASPNLSPKQVMAALHKGANKKDLKDPDGNDSCGGIAWNTFPNYIYGYGRLDCLGAYNTLKKDIV